MTFTSSSHGTDTNRGTASDFRRRAGTTLISCLTLTDVMRVAEEVTRGHEEFTAVAAVATTGGSSYAELLLRVRGRLALTTVGVFRDVSESQLQADISLALSVRASELGLA